MPGKFIVCEGVDGSGTTTQGQRLTERMLAAGHPCVFTREPSTGPVGKMIREILLGGHRLPDKSAVTGATMALLFAADRQDHLAREIEPALAVGIHVVCDRFLLSSLAYQIEDHGIKQVSSEPLAWVRSLAAGVRTPSLTMLLDVEIAVAAERRRKAGREVERYDADSYQERVRRNYLNLSARGVVILDASKSIDAVAEEIWFHANSCVSA